MAHQRSADHWLATAAKHWSLVLSSLPICYENSMVAFRGEMALIPHSTLYNAISTLLWSPHVDMRHLCHFFPELQTRASLRPLCFQLLPQPICGLLLISPPEPKPMEWRNWILGDGRDRVLTLDSDPKLPPSSPSGRRPGPLLVISYSHVHSLELFYTRV